MHSKQLNDEVAAKQAEIAELKTQQVALQRRALEAEDRATRYLQDLNQATVDGENQGQRLADLRSAKTDADEKLTAAHRRIRELEDDLARATADLHVTERELEAVQRDAADVDANLSSSSMRLGEMSTEVNALRADLAAAVRAKDDAVRARTAAREEMERKLDEQRRESRMAVERANEDRNLLKRETQRLQEHVSFVEKMVFELAQEAAEAKQKMAEQEGAVGDAQSALRRKEAELRVILKEADDARSNLSALTSAGPVLRGQSRSSPQHQ